MIIVNRPADERHLGPDLARALAIAGMILVNFEVMSEPGDEDGLLELLLTAIQGRASALFVVLAGVGLSFIARRPAPATDPRATEKRLLRRAAFLFVVGLALAPLWEPDILHFYGLFISVAALFVRRSGRLLVVGALACVAAFLTYYVLEDYRSDWDRVQNQVDDFWTLAGSTRRLLFTGYYPFFPWFAFLLFGLAVGRAGVTWERLRPLVPLALAAFVTAELLSLWLDTGSGLDLAFSATPKALVKIVGTGPYPPGPFYLISSAAGALLVLAACAWLSTREGRAVALARAPLVAAGRLSLSIYLAHATLGLGLLALLKWLFDELTLGGVFAAAFGFFAVSVLFASLWLRRFERGPFEGLMRRICD